MQIIIRFTDTMKQNFQLLGIASYWLLFMPIVFIFSLCIILLVAVPIVSPALHDTFNAVKELFQ